MCHRAPAGLATFAGSLSGLVGTYLALVMVLVVSRVPFVERVLGLDGLLRWHRRCGMLAPSCRTERRPDRHPREGLVTGRRSRQSRALGRAVDGWAAVVWKGRWGSWRTRGCGPAAYTPRNLDPREAGWGPHLRLPGLVLQLAGRRAVRGLAFPLVSQCVCGGPAVSTGIVAGSRAGFRDRTPPRAG